jgi:hypothetical protein
VLVQGGAQETQGLATRTGVGNRGRVGGEVLLPNLACSLTDPRQGDAGPDPLPLAGGDVLAGAVLGVAGDGSGPQRPTEACVPEQSEGGLILLPIRWGGQGGKDDARPAAVDAGVVVIAQVGAAIPERQRRGVRIGRADAQVRRASGASAGHRTVGTARVRDPVVPPRSAVREIGLRLLRQRDRQPHQLVVAFTGQSTASVALVFRRREELGAMRCNGEPRSAGGQRRSGRHLRGVDVQLLAPDQSRDGALLHDGLEEAAEDRPPVAFPDAGAARMVGERLGQVVAESVSAGAAGRRPPAAGAARSGCPAKQRLRCRVKKTTGSSEDRPPSAEASRTRSRTKPRSSARSRWREK